MSDLLQTLTTLIAIALLLVHVGIPVYLLEILDREDLAVKYIFFFVFTLALLAFISTF